MIQGLLKNKIVIQNLILEAYPKPYQTSKMERFTKKFFPPLHFFEKRSILDAWQDSQYASVSGHICPHLDWIREHTVCLSYRNQSIANQLAGFYESGRQCILPLSFNAIFLRISPSVWTNFTHFPSIYIVDIWHANFVL